MALKKEIQQEDGITTNCVYKENGKIVNRSSTRRNVKEDEFDFKEAVKNCVERVELNAAGIIPTLFNKAAPKNNKMNQGKIFLKEKLFSLLELFLAFFIL